MAQYLLYGSSCESPGRWEQALAQSRHRARQPSCQGEDMPQSDPLEGQRSSYRVPPVVNRRSTESPTKRTDLCTALHAAREQALFGCLPLKSPVPLSDLNLNLGVVSRRGAILHRMLQGDPLSISISSYILPCWYPRKAQYTWFHSMTTA